MNNMWNDHSVTARHHAHGWAVSACLHLCALGSALLLMAEVERPVLSQPIRLNFALVEPNLEAVSLPVPASAPPVVPDLPPPVPSKRSIERRVVAKQSIPAQEHSPVTREVTTTPAQLMTSPAQSQPSPQVRDIQQTEDTVIQRVQETSETQATQKTETTEEPVITQSITSASRSIVESIASVPVDRTVQTTQTAVERERPIDMKRILEKERAVDEAPSVERAAILRESPQAVPAPDVEQRLVTERPLQTSRETQQDYGWLAESLWQRIEQLKRYPTRARMRHWEGKVVLEAVIRDDGTILELRVEETSGHAILDQDALAVVKKASPLTLKHPLGQPRITILVPISYSLES